MPGPSLIGLTGGIAAGKSEVLRILGELGAEVISTDAVVHELLGDPAVRDRLIERWGDDVAPGGTVDRGKVGAIVFAEPDELEWLEGLLHPLVGKHLIEWRRGLRDDVEVGVVEVPLLFEGTLAGMFDATIAVVAEDETRAARAGARGTTDLEARSSRQLSQDEKAARATHVVRNDRSLAHLEATLRELMPSLEAAAG